MLDENGPSLWCWVIDVGGAVGPGREADAEAVSGHVADAIRSGGLVLAVTGLSRGREELASMYARLLPDGTAHPDVEVRPLTGPYVVPKSWAGPLGARGFVAGELRESVRWRVPLVVAAWEVGGEDAATGLEPFVGAVEGRKDAWAMTSPARVRTMLERLIATEDVAAGGVSQLDYAEMLRGCERVVDRYELAFRSGADFDLEEHARIEQLLQELVLRTDAFREPGMRAERLGLESRLVRLLNAQASRDSSGSLQRVLSALTALVLVPALVASVFGSNVPIPLERLPATRWTMFALMACSGLLSYLALTGIRQDSTTRGLTFRLPGARRVGLEDGSWLTRRLFAALVGAATAISVEAWFALWDSGAPGSRSSTTMSTLTLACVAVIGTLAWLAVSDLIERSPIHALADVVLAGGAAAAAAGWLVSDPILGSAGLVAAVLVGYLTRQHAGALVVRTPKGETPDR